MSTLNKKSGVKLPKLKVKSKNKNNLSDLDDVLKLTPVPLPKNKTPATKPFGFFKQD